MDGELLNVIPDHSKSDPVFTDEQTSDHKQKENDSSGGLCAAKADFSNYPESGPDEIVVPKAVDVVVQEAVAPSISDSKQQESTLSPTGQTASPPETAHLLHLSPPPETTPREDPRETTPREGHSETRNLRSENHNEIQKHPCKRNLAWILPTVMGSVIVLTGAVAIPCAIYRLNANTTPSKKHTGVEITHTTNANAKLHANVKPSNADVKPSNANVKPSNADVKLVSDFHTANAKNNIDHLQQRSKSAAVPPEKDGVVPESESAAVPPEVSADVPPELSADVPPELSAAVSELSAVVPEAKSLVSFLHGLPENSSVPLEMIVPLISLMSPAAVDLIDDHQDLDDTSNNSKTPNQATPNSKTGLIAGIVSLLGILGIWALVRSLRPWGSMQLRPWHYFQPQQTRDDDDDTNPRPRESIVPSQDLNPSNPVASPSQDSNPPGPVAESSHDNTSPPPRRVAQLQMEAHAGAQIESTVDQMPKLLKHQERKKGFRKPAFFLSNNHQTETRGTRFIASAIPPTTSPTVMRQKHFNKENVNPAEATANLAEVKAGKQSEATVNPSKEDAEPSRVVTTDLSRAPSTTEPLPLRTPPSADPSRTPATMPMRARLPRLQQLQRDSHHNWTDPKKAQSTSQLPGSKVPQLPKVGVPMTQLPKVGPGPYPKVHDIPQLGLRHEISSESLSPPLRAPRHNKHVDSSTLGLGRHEIESVFRGESGRQEIESVIHAMNHGESGEQKPLFLQHMHAEKPKKLFTVQECHAEKPKKLFTVPESIAESSHATTERSNAIAEPSTATTELSRATNTPSHATAERPNATKPPPSRVTPTAAEPSGPLPATVPAKKLLPPRLQQLRNQELGISAARLRQFATNPGEAQVPKPEAQVPKPHRSTDFVPRLSFHGQNDTRMQHCPSPISNLSTDTHQSPPQVLYSDQQSPPPVFRKSKELDFSKPVFSPISIWEMNEGMRSANMLLGIKPGNSPDTVNGQHSPESDESYPVRLTPTTAETIKLHDHE